LEIAIFIIVGLIILILFLSLIAPKKYSVEREVVINKPKAKVFEYLKQLKKQDNWSVWSKMDPNMKHDYRGTDATVGFVSAWEGNKNVGAGEQEILSIIDGERIDIELRFLKPWKSTSPVYLTTDAINEGQTKVTWGMSGKMPMPMNIMLLFMNMEKQLGKDFTDGLNNLKNILES